MYDYIAQITQQLPEIFHDWFDNEVSLITPTAIVCKGNREHPIEKTKLTVYVVKVWAEEFAQEEHFDENGMPNTEENVYGVIYTPRDMEICINSLGEIVNAELV